METGATPDANTTTVPAQTRPTNVLICASGSVAGIKVALLAEQLQAAGLRVIVAVTQHGRVFVEKSHPDGPAELVYYTDADAEAEAEAEAGAAANEADAAGHDTPRGLDERLCEWADLLLMAPLSANTLAKLALGLCDNLVTRIARGWAVGAKPLLLAPAMNTKMWIHPATVAQLDALRALGARVVAPIEKKLACGDVGVGAMASVPSIVAAVVESVGGGCRESAVLGACE